MLYHRLKEEGNPPKRYLMLNNSVVIKNLPSLYQHVSCVVEVSDVFGYYDNNTSTGQ